MKMFAYLASGVPLMILMLGLLVWGRLHGDTELAHRVADNRICAVSVHHTWERRDYAVIGFV